jgi:prolyl-tRNA synthetase
VALKAELVDYAPVHGFMTIRPRGYMLWESIQHFFDPLIKKQGVSNAYFPLLIPESFFNKEKKHAEGFTPEVAWIAKDENDKDSERLAIRPTSETIIYDSFSKWIRSWRDLPLRVNQWCNVVRWEIKQTKLFLRTREFLWQEGHCAYATEQACDDDAQLFLRLYEKVCRELLAIPVIPGKKTESEKFAGAKTTYTIESLMPDGKAVQMGTSHNLGQNFSKAFDVTFLDQSEKQQHAWLGSWGISTRLIGAVIMMHGDDKGLVIPPRMASQKVVIVPITFEDSGKEAILKECRKVALALQDFGAFIDDREAYTPGFKFNEWEMKGTPIRIEIGPKDVEKKQCVLVSRDNGKKQFVSLNDINQAVFSELDSMHQRLLEKAEKVLSDNVVEVKTKIEFKKVIEERKMAVGHFCETSECEEKIKTETTATSRVIPLPQDESKSTCFYCEKPSKYLTYFAKSY